MKFTFGEDLPFFKWMYYAHEVQSICQRQKTEQGKSSEWLEVLKNVNSFVHPDVYVGKVTIHIEV